MRTPLAVVLAAGAAAVMAGGVAYAAGANTTAVRAGADTVNVTPLAAVDSAVEAKYTSIAPCRAVDTRRAGGALGNGTQRTFHVGGTDFTGQGGGAAGCGVPTNPTAVAVTITTVASHPGYLKAWAAGAAEPATSFMNYGTAFNSSTGGNVPVSPNGGTITIRNANGPTQVIVDVTGYYAKPMSAHVNTNGTLATSSRVTGITKGVTGFYTLTFDRVVSSCVYTTAPFFNGFTVRAEPARAANAVEIRVNNSSGTDTDSGFYLLVSC